MNIKTSAASATPPAVEIQPDRGGRNRKGTLVNRNGIWHLQVMVAGKYLRKSLDTGDKRKAESLRAGALDEMGITARGVAETLARVQERLESTTAKVARVEGQREAERATAETAAARLPLGNTWVAYLASATRPQTGRATLAVYFYWWGTFVRWLAARGVKRLAELSPATLQAYLQHLRSKRLAVGSQRKHFIVLKLVVKHLPSTEGIRGDLFSWLAKDTFAGVAKRRQEIPLPQLAKVCDRAEGELKTLLFLGVYSGMRLKDCATLQWGEIDIDGGLITRVAAKLASRHGEALRIPIHPCLLPLLLSTPAEARTGDVLPELAALHRRAPGYVTSRVQAHLAACGLDLYYAQSVNGPARKALRYGFHSLRHSAVSLWKRAGVSQSTAMELAGHHSASISAIYTHTSAETLRQAIDGMPSLSTATRKALPAGGQETPEAAEDRRIRAQVRQLADTMPIEALKALLQAAGMNTKVEA